VPISQTERKAAILNAAMIAFGRYGFKRTNMEDIAVASGIARTALYKLYRNKEHIFQDLVEQVHTEALTAAKTILRAEGDIGVRLSNALIARDTHLLKIGHSGPHADEIAELYSSLARELAQTYNGKLVQVLKDAIEEARATDNYILPSAFKSSEDMAHLLRLSLEGIKTEVKLVPQFETLARQLISALMT